MPDSRLPGGSRLRGPGAFKAVFAARRVLRARFLSVHARRVPPADADACETNSARLGLVVGKRQCPLSNRRNLLKRLVRERFRLARCDLDRVDLVFRLSQPLPRGDRPEIRRLLGREIDMLFRRIEEAYRKP